VHFSIHRALGNELERRYSANFPRHMVPKCFTQTDWPLAGQSQPGIVLRDEMKPAQGQNISVQCGQSVNQINSQIR
jgi:hypothetical protein